MIQIRKSKERGHFNHGWLDTYHTFSFGDYYDSDHMSFRSLRVLNEDRVQPGNGFGTHPHRDMEIITYVLEGELEHKDNLGNGSIIQAGEVQRITAGTGITHSEFNPSSTSVVHLFQIWIVPEERGLTPGYEQRQFSIENEPGQLHLIASHDGREGSLRINQDVDMFKIVLDPSSLVGYSLKDTRYGWIQVTRGEIVLNGNILLAGDGASIDSELGIELQGVKPSEILLIDLS